MYGVITGPELAAAATAHGGSVLESVVLPQIKRHVAQTMLAAEGPG